MQQGFTSKEPLFPQISSQFHQFNLLHSRITHKPIQSDTTIREVFRHAFEAAGFPYKGEQYRGTDDVEEKEWLGKVLAEKSGDLFLMGWQKQNGFDIYRQIN